MIKVLLGGSPCTHWSINQKSERREVEASGTGWELFQQYTKGIEEFKPDYFLYENNKSIAPAIQASISVALGVQPQMVDSALVSAQSRKRLYWHNLGDIPLPENRGIILADIIIPADSDTQTDYSETAVIYQKPRGFNKGKVLTGKAPTMTSSCWQENNLLLSPIRVGEDGVSGCHQGNRIYSIDGKSVTQTASSGGKYKVDLPDGDYTVRKLSVAECCRLQTLPDNYCDAVSKTQAYKGLGNGWTAEVVTHLLGHALKGVPKDAPLDVLSLFDGIGTGLYCLKSLGFTNIKYTAIEQDKYARAIADSQHGGIIRPCDDVFEYFKK